MGLFGGAPRPEPYEKETPGERPALPRPQVHTVIAQDMTLQGTICGEGAVQIEGTVEGEITLKGTLTVTPTGKIKGPVKAETIRVAGTVLGDIEAGDHLRLSSTGNIEGNIKTPSLVVEDGGCLNGRTTMVKRKQEGSVSEGPQLSDLQFGSNYNPEEDAES